MRLIDADMTSDVVELPCKIGDTVYFETYEKSGSACVGIQPHKIVAYRLGMVIEDKYGAPTTVLPDYEFGRTVFLSREDAERALKERRKSNG